MMISFKGQISIEYLVVLGFVTFLVISVLGLSLVYIDSVRDTIKFRQTEAYATKVVRAAESVYYAGQPSKVHVQAYVPVSVSKIEVLREGLLITVTASSGEAKTLFSSAVPLNSSSGTLPASEGLKDIELSASADSVVVSSS